MSAYQDLIPGPSPSRRRSAYDDLLPGSAPAAAVQPAEDARFSGDEAVTEPRVADAARQINEEIIAAQPARATMSRRGGVQIAPADLTLQEPEQPGTRLADAARAAAPALKTVQAVASGYPVVETAANLATGSVAMPVSGITGLAAAVAKAMGADVNPGDVVHKTAEALTYQPKTALGQHLTSAVLYPIEKLQELGRAAGERDQDTGGSPGSAATVETLVNAVPLLLGARGGAEQPKAARVAPEVAAAPKPEPLAPKRIEPKQEEAASPYADLVPAGAPDLAGRIEPVLRDEPKAPVKPDWSRETVDKLVAPVEEGTAVRTEPVKLKDGTKANLEATNIPSNDGGGQLRFSVKNADGEVMGGGGLFPKAGGKPGEWEAHYFVNEPYRRQGVLTAAMDWFEENTGQKVRPSEHPSEQAQAFWKARDTKELALAMPAEAPKSLEPWQMARDDYVASFKGQRVEKAVSSGGQGRFNRLGTLRNAHREAVDAALQLGKAVSPEVRAEYPELVKKYSGIGDSGSLGMPAGAAVAPGAIAPAAPVPPGAGARVVPTEQARPDAIRKAMRELFGAPISEKHQGRNALGIYRIKPETIRLRNRNDLRTASHEVGHHISNTNKAFRAVMKSHENELIPMMPAAYKQQIAAGKPMPRKLQIEEGFAEFIAEYLGDRPVAKSKAPTFFKAFESWLEQNPRYKAGLNQVADMLGAHEALSPEAKILAKVGAYAPPWKERIGALASKGTYDAFVQATLDKWHPLKLMVDDLAPGLAQSKNPYGAARRLAGDAAVIEDWVGNFTSPFDYAKRVDPKNYGESLKAVLDPILAGGEKEINKFKAYLIARRAAELKKVGKENLFTPEEIAQGLTLETGQPGRSRLFEATANKVYQYNDRLLDYAVEGGLLSADVAAKFRQYTAYIPFFREAEGAGKPGGRGEPFKRLMGGTANVRDPIANLIQNTANIIHATNRNAVVSKAVELAKAIPGGGRWIETVPLPMQAHNLATARIIKQLEEQGVVIDTQMAQSLASMQTFFTKSGKGDDRTRTIVYKAGGELKAAQVNDPLLWKAIGNMPPLELGLIGKMLAFPAQTLRAGVVLDPTFMVRNFVRDTLSATVQSKGSFIPVASTAEGIRLMAQQKDAYKLWRSFGGAFADQFREPQESAAVLARMAKRGNFNALSIITPTRWLDALRKVGSFTESGSRIGEFKATYKPGDFESALQAALNSREVSTDFGMKGGSDAIQVLTRITPFMNPAMQGLYKTARVLSTGDGKAVAGKAAVIGTGMALASVALALLNSDEEWYQQIEEWEKTTYWHFKLAGQVWRIPKPFEYGTLFASVPEAIALRAAGKEDGEDFKKRMLQALGQVFGFRVIPQAATATLEPIFNHNFFTGRKIVPDRQQHLEAGLQANPGTTKSAQVVGEAANVSPAKIDNAVRNVFGTLGVHVSTVGDLILEASGAVPPSRERGWQTWPAIKAFVRDPDNPNTKQQRDFYEALDKYRTAVASLREYKNRGEDDKAAAYETEKKDDLDAAKKAEERAKRLAKIRASIRKIEWDREMTPAQKRAEINAKNEEMQGEVEEHTLLYQAAKKSYSRPAEGGK